MNDFSGKRRWKKKMAWPLALPFEADLPAEVVHSKTIH
jgi:hypothetical protein